MGVSPPLNGIREDSLLLPGLMTHISGDVNFPAQCVISADASPPRNDGKLPLSLRLVGSVPERRQSSGTASGWNEMKKYDNG